jgi:hypothetical protein
MYRFDDNRFKKQSSVSISNIEHSKYFKTYSKINTKTQPRQQPHMGAAANGGAATGAEAMETAAAGAADTEKADTREASTGAEASEH